MDEQLEELVKSKGDEIQIIVTTKNTNSLRTAPAMSMENIKGCASFPIKRLAVDVSPEFNNNCPDCGCAKSLHHGNQKQKNEDGSIYIRTCYGIACKCTLLYPEVTNETLKIGKGN